MEKENNIDIRTPHEIKREQLRDTICAEFLASYRKFPDYAPNRHITALARAHNLTTMGVRNILINRGVYRVNGRCPQIIVPGGAQQV